MTSDTKMVKHLCGCTQVIYCLCSYTQLILLPLMSTDIPGTETAWMGSMRSKHHYDVELNVMMGEDRLGSTSTEGPL